MRQFLARFSHSLRMADLDCCNFADQLKKRPCGRHLYASLNLSTLIGLIVVLWQMLGQIHAVME
jgi:hypothetical protein